MTALPFGPPIEPMLARLTADIPEGSEWHYEPKWDGFRALVFFDGEEAYLQSRDLKPLKRYFPEVAAGLESALGQPAVLDGEIVIMSDDGLAFDALQMRIHPAESRVRMLAEQTPAAFVAFDLLAYGAEDLRGRPFADRHERLSTAFTGTGPPLFLTPASRDAGVAHDWFDRFEGAGFDGVIARKLNEAYLPGARAMAKIKHLREADCVVGGFRWAKGSPGTAVGSLLLGLYDADGILHHVGHTSSFKADQRRELADLLRPFVTDDEEAGFGRGRTPGTPSRWSGGKDTAWMRVRPDLVCQVTFDHLQGARFRHAATFQRWRPDKPPAECTYDQLETTMPYELARVFDKEQA